jgi:hypothetical protein
VAVEELPASVEFHEFRVTDAGLEFRGSHHLLLRGTGIRFRRSGLVLDDGTTLSWAENLKVSGKDHVGWSIACRASGWVGSSMVAEVGFVDHARNRWDIHWDPWDRKVAVSINFVSASATCSKRR